MSHKEEFDEIIQEMFSSHKIKGIKRLFELYKKLLNKPESKLKFCSRCVQGYITELREYFKENENG